MTRPSPISRLAHRCAMFGCPASLRESLAEQTLRLASAAAVRLALAGEARWCDADCIAVDAAAWCMGDGLRRYRRTRSAWSTYVSAAVRREAERMSAEEARLARVRAEILKNEKFSGGGTPL